MNNNRIIFSNNTPGTVIIRSGLTVLLLISANFAATGQATSPAIRLRTIAEVETHVVENGRDVVRLMPADHLVPGDQVIFTVEIRNAGSVAVVAPVVINPIPAHTRYVADSATGPGAEVSYSIDGGRTFERAESLKLRGTDGRLHVANPLNYTHIRWDLKKTLKSKSTAYARFRAVVK
jgi:uncharacterized repeat protein (TIGR01451 family)